MASAAHGSKRCGASRIRRSSRCRGRPADLWQTAITCALTRPIPALTPFAFVTVLASAAPFNSTSDGTDETLVLKGHDPVAYFVSSQHVLGSPSVKAQHDGATYRFASA
jgi:hypothetical protein